MTIHTGSNEKMKPLKVRVPDWIGKVEGVAMERSLKPDRLRAVLHQFFLAWLKNKTIRKNGRSNYTSDYFPVSAEILKEVGTRDYAHYVNLLLSAHIIERKIGSDGLRCYMPGRHAQLYRWNSPVCEPTFRVESIMDQTTLKSVYRTRDNHQRLDMRCLAAKPLLSVFETLRSFVLDTVLAGDHFQADDVLNELNWFVVDEFGGRFHHRISSMPKEQRKYLRFKGNEEEPLITLDIKNSQPFFTALVSSKALIDQLMPEFRPVIAIAEKYANKPDFLLYRELCITGRIYEFLMEAKALPINDKIERDKIKEQLFRAVIYCKKRVYGADKLFQSLFKSSFPSVFSFFSDVKSLDETHLPDLSHIIKSPNKKKFKYARSNDSHKILPCMMQRAESRMMYRVIAPKLIAKGIKFITIHDSFLILPTDLEQTQSIIKKSFEDMGLPEPALSVTSM